MKSNFYYITTPIYYTNGFPHIGHAYTSVISDILARIMRLRNYEVVFLTGTDEHGSKIEQAARKTGKDLHSFTEEISHSFRKMGETLNLSKHQFIRTTEKRHNKAAQAFWRELTKLGFIYKGIYSGWYSVQDEAFYESSELIDGKTPTGSSVEWLEEPSYFFRLSSFQENLLNFYRRNPRFIEPRQRMNEVLRFIEGGLQDLSISRSSVRWGIPVPGDPDHVMYVWIDALVSYLTAISYPDTSSQNFKTFWLNAVHVLGKDILRFHGVYWIALLMAAGVDPPKHLYVHGWWMEKTHKQKISKSDGDKKFELQSLVDIFGSDRVRYFLIRGIQFGQDGVFSEKDLVRCANSDLSNHFGNLAKRVLSLVYNDMNAIIPNPEPLTESDSRMIRINFSAIPVLKVLKEEKILCSLCRTFLDIITKSNRYLEREKPWLLKESNPSRMGTILYVMLVTLYCLSILASPIMPKACSQLLDCLSIPEKFRTIETLSKSINGSFLIPLPGARIAKPEQLFQRIFCSRLGDLND